MISKVTSALAISLQRATKRFSRDTSGSVNIEAILFFPFLVGLVAVTMVLYDGFRTSSLNQKAAYTVGDLFSRETNVITPAHIEGARDFAATMVGVAESDMTVRVTQVIYDATNDTYSRSWSHAVGAHDGSLSSAEVNARANELPVLSHGERVILVDTFVDHDWAIDVGMNSGSFQASIVTRPRFAPQLAWSN